MRQEGNSSVSWSSSSHRITVNVILLRQSQPALTLLTLVVLVGFSTPHVYSALLFILVLQMDHRRILVECPKLTKFRRNFTQFPDVSCLDYTSTRRLRVINNENKRSADFCTAVGTKVRAIIVWQNRKGKKWSHCVASLYFIVMTYHLPVHWVHLAQTNRAKCM